MFLLRDSHLRSHYLHIDKQLQFWGLEGGGLYWFIKWLPCSFRWIPFMYLSCMASLQEQEHVEITMWPTDCCLEIFPTLSFPGQSSPEGLGSWFTFSVSCHSSAGLSFGNLRAYQLSHIIINSWAGWVWHWWIPFHIKETSYYFPKTVPQDALGLLIWPPLQTLKNGEWLCGNGSACFSIQGGAEELLFQNC